MKCEKLREFIKEINLRFKKTAGIAARRWMDQGDVVS